MVSVKQRRKEGKVYSQSYNACRQIGNEKPFGAIDKIILRVKVIHTLVEISGLEEEERHEVKRPFHYMRPPLHLSHPAEVHDVKTDHTNDTQSAQEVECMVPILHLPSY